MFHQSVATGTAEFPRQLFNIVLVWFAQLERQCSIQKLHLTNKANTGTAELSFFRCVCDKSLIHDSINYLVRSKSRFFSDHLSLSKCLSANFLSPHDKQKNWRNSRPGTGPEHAECFAVFEQLTSLLVSTTHCFERSYTTK